MSGDPGFNAPESALGYLYQCRYALLLAMRRLKSEPDIAVSIEKFDDIAFEEAGTPVELIQTKHHLRAAGSLTDSSVDLWKTLRIWCTGVSNETIAIPGTLLNIVTTGSAPAGSAASRLRHDERDAGAAERALATVARTSQNKENEAAYAAFLALQHIDRVALLDEMFVIDAEPTILDLPAQLQSEMYFAADVEHLPSLVSRLEGWWFGEVIKQMASPGGAPVLGADIDGVIADLRDQLAHDNLPIDDDLRDWPEPDDPLADQRNFVHQLRLIGLKSRRIAFAIQDYCRAFEQRSRWMRQRLVLVGELARYEKRLREEWNRHFEIMKEELGDAAAEHAKLQAGSALYKWMELEADLRIRERCQEPFVMRGSYHILSEKQQIGWHPEFIERLRTLLSGKESVA